MKIFQFRQFPADSSAGGFHCCFLRPLCLKISDFILYLTDIFSCNLGVFLPLLTPLVDALVLNTPRSMGNLVGGIFRGGIFLRIISLLREGVKLDALMLFIKISTKPLPLLRQLMSIIGTKLTGGKNNTEKKHKSEKKAYTNGYRIIKEKRQTDKRNRLQKAGT